MDLWMIAFRNVFRNPRRSLLNILAIGIGVMVVLTMKGWIGGFSQTAYQTQMELDTAQVQILNAGYQGERQRLPLDLRIDHWKAVKTAVENQPGVVGVGARIDFGAEITNGTTAIRVMARGVDPEGEAKLTTLKNSLQQGQWFQATSEVLVGAGLARKLKLQVGDQIFLTALDQYGVKNLVDGTVGAIFSLGYALFDDNLVFTTLTKAQETLALPDDAATRVVIRFSDRVRTADHTAQIARVLAADPGFSGLKTYEWREFAQTVVNSIEGRVRIMSFMMGILVLLVIVGILNSMSMAVQERFREIGTLRAIGMNRRKLSRLFLAEGFTLGLLGGLAGMAAALILAAVGLWMGIDIRPFLPKEIPIPFTSVMYPLYWPLDFPLAALAAALVAVIGSLLPARRAGQMVIRDALGSHG